MGRDFKVVILGGGTAAGYAALEFVKNGLNHGEVCIISEEPVPPYERPALSKGFLLAQDPARLPSFFTCVGTNQEKLVPKWYKDNGIELILDTRVVSVDVKRKTLLTSYQETICYESLIVATGARVLRLEEFGVTGAVAPNICYLRNLKDAEDLVNAMAICISAGGKAVVIGGGYIGMECAAALTNNHINVTMIFPEPHCMARLFTPEIAAFYEEAYSKRGVTFKKGTVTSGFERNEKGEVVAVLLKDGSRLPANLVVVGVGIRPNVSLFEGQLALQKGGIKVNGQMRTSDSSVYAVGDVASFPLKMYGSVQKLEHVDHARKSAVHAVQSLLEPKKKVDYDYMPFFYSRVFSLCWQFFGSNSGTSIMFGDPITGKFGAYWVENGRLVGVFLEGGTKDDYDAISRLAKDRPEVEDLSELSMLGLQFALSHVSVPVLPRHLPVIGPTTETQLFLRNKNVYVLQASAGVAVAVAVAALGYWYGRRRRKL